MKYYKAIISHLRSDNVEKMQELVGKDLVWYVGEGEKQNYLDSGATNVIESGTLCHSRNQVLKDSTADYSVQLSDDLKRFERVKVLGDKKYKVPISLDDVLEEITSKMEKYNL